MIEYHLHYESSEEQKRIIEYFINKGYKKERFGSWHNKKGYIVTYNNKIYNRSWNYDDHVKRCNNIKYLTYLDQNPYK